MEQKDDGRVGETRFTIEDSDPVSLNAMVRRERNVGNVCHTSPRNIRLLDEIKRSALTMERTDHRKGGSHKATTINAQRLPCLCCLLQPSRRPPRPRLIRIGALPEAV